jgi:tetratricopeptide (TPR) repeat protein
MAIIIAGSVLFAESGDDAKLLYSQPFTISKGDYLLKGKESQLAKLITRLKSKKERTSAESVDLAYAYHITGDRKKALSEFKRALEMGNVDPRCFNMIGGILVEDGKSAEAEEYYRKTIQKYPDNETALYNIAEIMFSNGNLAESKKLAEKIIVGNPEYYDVHQLLGLIAEKENKYDDAEKMFRAEIKIYPSSPVSHRHIAECIAKRGGDINETIHHYRMALNSMPYNEETRKLIIAAYEKKGGESLDIAKAEKNFLGLKAPDDTLYNYAMYFVFMDSSDDDFKGAIMILQEQIKRYPDYLSANVNIGGIYSRLGDTEKAYKYFLNEFKIDPNNASAVYNIAFYYIKQMNTSKTAKEQASSLAIAKVFFHRCVLIDPLDSSAAEYEKKIDQVFSRRKSPE